MSVVGIHHVTLLVQDGAKAAWFYGEVLGFAQKPRPAFNFPGLFYPCGDQELHLIISARPLSQEDLFILWERWATGAFAIFTGMRPSWWRTLPRPGSG